MEQSPSSTSSSRTLDLADFRLPYGALVALALVCAVEAGLHLWQDRLPEPVLWGQGETSTKVAQVRERVGPGGGADILILGPSHSSVGISPAAMLGVASLRMSIYNGSLNGRMYPVLEFLYRHVYRPALKPSILVLSASPLVFNAWNQRMERNSAEFFDAPMPSVLREARNPAQALEAVWRRFLIENLYLYRFRRRMVGLAEGALRGGRRLDRFGFRGLAGSWDDAGRENLASEAHPYRRIMNRFEFGGPSVEAFEELLVQARADCSRVVVVNMPFRRELLEISRTGPADYDEYLRNMAALRDRHAFVWLDYQGGLPLGDGDFHDVDHLNGQGAAKLSWRLAEDLARLVRTDSDPGNGVREALPSE